MEKIFALLMTFAYVIGVIGGIGYTLHDDAYIVSLCIAVVAYFGFGNFITLFKELIK